MKPNSMSRQVHKSFTETQSNVGPNAQIIIITHLPNYSTPPIPILIIFSLSNIIKLSSQSPQQGQSSTHKNSMSSPAPDSDDRKPAAKREVDELYDAGSDDDFTPKPPQKKKKYKRRKKSADPDELDPTGQVFAAELLPAPYFYYRNHSNEMDVDPLTPVTQAGHVPCFPVKMHAILADRNLHHIVAWDDHGRSFRILKPKKFEFDILPRFFDHQKFSSFIRQANGWGFRRLLSGPNRNSYYQEYFLRSMPWLCKKMRRPKVGEKKGISVGKHV